MKLLRAISKVAMLLSFIFFTLGCDDEAKQIAAKEKMIQDEFQFRLDNWNRELEKGCRERALNKAITIVDSILIATAHMKRDTTGRLFIPARPERPEFQQSPDTIPVKPLIQFKKDTVKG